MNEKDTRKSLENKRIEAATRSKPVSKPVDNLLCLVFTINRDTGKVLDVVSKPSICNKDVTGYPQQEITSGDAVTLLEKMGYTVKLP